MAGTQQVRDVAHRGAGEESQRRTVHLEKPSPSPLDDADAVCGQQAVRRLVRAKREQLAEGEVGHDPSVRRKVPRVPVTEHDRQAGRLALGALLATAVVRILVAVIAGFIAIGQHDDFGVGRQHLGEVLNVFGTAGDSIEALIAVAAAALVWWLSRQSAVSRGVVSALRAIVVVTVLMVVARASAFLVIDVGHLGYQLTVVIGLAVADLLLCAGILLVLGRLREVDLDPMESDDLEPDQIEPLLFAVDRGNGEMFAFFSFAQARRTISGYSIEEDEYAFYTDEGHVVLASTDGFAVHFTPTPEERREDLMQALRHFAQARNLTVQDPQDPTSYAVPISDWQWLELWPGWLRPIGRLVRRLKG